VNYLEISSKPLKMPKHHKTDEGPGYGHYQGEIYHNGLQGHRPLMTTDPRKWEQAAKDVLHVNSYGYIAGGAGSCATMDANRAAFRRWTIIPRMLRDNTVRDLSVELFGETYPSPILVAPVGVNTIVCDLLHYFCMLF
jgi:lactate 2-monooxygenase